MASEPLTVLPVFDPESESAPKEQDRVWRPVVNSNDFITRYADAIADMANHGGIAVTSFFRWLLLTVGCIGLLIADGCVRLDKFVVRELDSMGVRRG